MTPDIQNASFIENAALQFNEYPTVVNDDYLIYLHSHGLQCSTLDQYSFYEKILTAQRNWSALACLYAKSGRLDDALETVKKSDDPYLEAFFHVRKGDIANAQILNERPAKNCSYHQLLGWVRYHEFNGTLEYAVTGFEHEIEHYNGLISLIRHDYPSAVKQLNNCPDVFKIYLAYAYIQLGQYDKAQAQYDEWFRVRDTQTLCFLDEFELWHTLLAHIKTEDIHSFGLAYNLYNEVNLSLVVKYFASLKDQHKTPILTLFYHLITNDYTLDDFLKIQNDSPFNDIDRLIFAHCHRKKEYQMLIRYCEKREEKTGAWQFSHKWAETQSFLSNDLSPEILNKMHALCEESVRKERPPFIQKFLALHYVRNKKLQLAKSFFDEHTRFYGHTTETILGIHACSQASAEIYIILSSLFNKNPQILDIVYEYSKNKPVGHVDFSHQNYHEGFRKKVEAHNKEEKESKTAKLLEDLELNEVSTSAALTALKEKNRKDDLDYFLYAYFLFLSDKKGPALFDLKRVNFDEIPVEKLIRALKKMVACNASFLIFAAKYLPTQGKITLAEYYLSIKKHEDANGLISEVLRKQSNHYAAHLKILCLLGMKKPAAAKTFVEDYPEYQLAPLLPMINAALQTESAPPAAPAPAAASAKAPGKLPATNSNLIMTGFALEKPRPKEERIEKVVRHNFGGTKQKGAVNPIQHSSGFDPKKYKPKEDEAPEARAESKKMTKPVKSVEALVETKISAHYRKTLEHARTLVLKAHLSKELFDKKEINEAALRNNLLYTYLRVFEIISFKTINPELLNSLQSKRLDSRHHFYLIPSVNAVRCFQYLSDIKLEAQLFGWIQGTGTIHHLALSPVQLIDEELKAKWDALTQIQKDNERIKTMKTELNNLMFFMENIKTESVLAGDGPYENAAKMSIVMIGMCWSQLRPTEKNKLAPYFRPYKLDGNLGAHQFKHDTEQGHIKFMHIFEDIPIENMWKFVQEAPKLIAYLADMK